MYVIYDENDGTVKLIEEMFNEVIFEVFVNDELDVWIMIDFLLLYANIISLG
ncbi:hypothetical protein JZO77_05900 [Enterococcus hulanensis]|uniref:hypothetical protein n=1 Tax=Enterococcus hulanensis TaxID=2559929 RepID=UPI001A8E1745|nr:hypothetical protein [Enterococcus hulanensis]MBO0456270.1 hypothetical protein [Enterococcus hulanensis]